VSPRNYFLYTPLLPAVAVGTMEERRCASSSLDTVVGGSTASQSSTCRPLHVQLVYSSCDSAHRQKGIAKLEPVCSCLCSQNCVGLHNSTQLWLRQALWTGSRLAMGCRSGLLQCVSSQVALCSTVTLTDVLTCVLCPSLVMAASWSQ
jgi:hypothetical protein